MKYLSLIPLIIILSGCGTITLVQEKLDGARKETAVLAYKKLCNLTFNAEDWLLTEYNIDRKSFNKVCGRSSSSPRSSGENRLKTKGNSTRSTFSTIFNSLG